MSTDEPTPPPAPDYGQPTAPPPGGGYGAPPPPSGGYGAPPPGGGYGAPPTGSGGYSVGDALSYGWSKFQANLGPILLLGLIVLVGVIIFGGIGYGIQSLITHGPEVKVGSDGSFESSSGSGFFVGMIANGITSALNFIVTTVLGAFVIRGALDLTEGRPLEVGSILGRLNIPALLILGIIEAVIVFIGILLCFLPGIIAAFLLYFSTYFLVDKDLSPVDAIKASFNLVKDNLGSALVWAIVATIVSFVGLCLCGVGYLVTFPVAVIGTAYTYKKLTGQAVAA